MYSVYFSIFIFMQLVAKHPTLIFETSSIDEGHFQEYPKDKHGVNQLGEDSFGTSKNSLVVCDGVGGSNFSSKYISNLIANDFQISILKKSRSLNSNFFKDDFYFNVIKSNIDNTILDYNTHLKNMLINWQQTNKKQFPIKPTQMGSSTTFIGAVLVNDKIEPKVKFIQKGDSLAVVFRKTESAKKGHFYYLPVYMTAEQQFRFNFPYQFSTEVRNYNSEVFNYSFNAKNGDLVVLGSDGLFDNLHLGFLTILINSFLAFPETDTEAYMNKFEKIVKIYVEILKKKNWVVQEFYKRGNFFSFAEENNHDAALPNGAGRIMYNVWKGIIGNKRNEQILPNMPNAFAKYLNEKMGNVLMNSDMNSRERNAFKSYFECPVLKMMSIPNRFGENNELISRCIKHVLENNFSVKEPRFDNFMSLFSGKFYSNLISQITEIVSKIPENYPNPFYVHAWSEGIGHALSGNGKRDDITVVFGLIKEVPDVINPDESRKLEKAFKDANELLLKSMEADVYSFLDYFLNLKEPKLRKSVLVLKEAEVEEKEIKADIQNESEKEELENEEQELINQELIDAAIEQELNGASLEQEQFFDAVFETEANSPQRNSFSETRKSFVGTRSSGLLSEIHENEDDNQIDAEQTTEELVNLTLEKNKQILEATDDEEELFMLEIEKEEHSNQATIRI